MSQTDTLGGSRENLQATAYQGEQPVVELAAEEWIYPISTPNGRLKLNIHLKPYSPYAVKKFLDLILPRRKARTAQQSVLDSDYTCVMPFVDDHFLGLSGVTMEDGTTPTAEQQKAWIDQNSDFKIRAFRDGVDNISLRKREEETPVATGRVVLVMGRPESLIETDIGLHSKGTRRDELIRVNHALARMSESDRHQYDRAIKLIEDTRARETFLEANWDVIEGLYNKLVKSLTGAVLAGEPCTESNKDAWVKVVPFCWKVYVMSMAYQEVELKNA